MSLFQIVAILFALLMMYVIDIHKKTARITSAELWVWRGLWLAFILLAIFPQTLLGVVNILHFARVFDLLVIIAFMVITFLVVTIYLKQREITRKLDTSIREESIKEFLITQSKKK